MSNKLDIELMGMDKLLRDLNELGARGSKIENQALKAGAEPILEHAKMHAPRKTGDGIEGLTIGRPKRNGDTKHILIGIDKGDISPIFYMKFHEFGTTFHRELRFLSNAYTVNQDKSRKLIIETLKIGLGLTK